MMWQLSTAATSFRTVGVCRFILLKKMRTQADMLKDSYFSPYRHCIRYNYYLTNLQRFFILHNSSTILTHLLLRLISYHPEHT